MIYREYDAGCDLYALLRLLDEFWTEVHRENLNRMFVYEGQKFNGLEGKLYQFLNEGCKITVAESEDTLIGFLIYHLIYDTICVTRALYLVPEKRKCTLMYGFYREMIKNGVKKVYSQDYINHEPKEMRGETSKRKLLAQKDGMNIWEYSF